MSDKVLMYQEIQKSITAVLEGEANITALMATVACLLHQAFPDRFIWTGFYVVDPLQDGELVVGPYQGELGCLRIPSGKGVCGIAAETRKTVLVDDVHEFPNHITCDARARSEIVIPVLDGKGKLLAVLDIDSADVGSFDKTDQEQLEKLVTEIFGELKV